jgi:alkylation response protein AidB-like acyl-CoA dehydrogenase
MDFDLTDEQRQLSDSLERLLTQQYGMDQRKAIIDSASGFSDAVWSKLAELGILSLPVSEASGGFGGGAVDLMRPMALIGHALVVEPVLPQLVSQRLLDRATSGSKTATVDSAAAESVGGLLQQAMAGRERLAWAHGTSEEPGLCTATASGKDWVLNGAFTGVSGAEGAGHLLVTTRTQEGSRGGSAALFLVPVNTAGVRLHAGRALDNQRIADVAFEGARVGARQRIAEASAAVEAIEDASDFASALLCAEAVGLIDYACQATLEYLKTRKQFGTTIGSFQALQHRIVDLHVELEQVRSMAALACSKYDAAGSGQIPVAERAKAVAGARVLVGKAATKVAQESVQLHGGMGMAEEMKISHTFRRLTVLAQQSGGIGFFLDRFIAADRQL